VHGAVNAFNEYEDIKSGLDFKTQRTPFSGGSGTIVPVPEK
jgi:1,4-dihydroxy-2-naphthoate octaprenyltransferase